MNNLTSLFPPNYKNLEQPAAIKLLEKIEKAVEEQDKQLEFICGELTKVSAENRDLKHIGTLFQGKRKVEEQGKGCEYCDNKSRYLQRELYKDG